MHQITKRLFPAYFTAISFLNPIRRLFPCTCLVCQQSSDELVCQPCLGSMQNDALCCSQCGEPMPEWDKEKELALTTDKPQRLCGRCLSDPPPFDRTLFAFVYQQHAASLIKGFKYNENLISSQFLASSIAKKIMQSMPASMPTILIPVPLHPSRLRQRGFNQSHELAKRIGKQLDIAVNAKAIKRTRDSKPQTGLSQKARAENVKSAFTLSHHARASLHGKHLAIVDDVITTGATVSAISRVLGKAKPSRISVLAVAKRHKH